PRPAVEPRRQDPVGAQQLPDAAGAVRDALEPLSLHIRSPQRLDRARRVDGCRRARAPLLQPASPRPERVAAARNRRGGDRRDRADHPMTVYVALLRGVNVGGRGKVDMRHLKQQVESLGCTDVSTYINSGNVMFRDRRAASTLTRELEKLLGRRVSVRSLGQVQALCERIPDDWGNDKEQKTDVGFAL